LDAQKKELVKEDLMVKSLVPLGEGDILGIWKSQYLFHEVKLELGDKEAITKPSSYHNGGEGGRKEVEVF
jgi:hypothetical protein